MRLRQASKDDESVSQPIRRVASCSAHANNCAHLLEVIINNVVVQVSPGIQPRHITADDCDDISRARW